LHSICPYKCIVRHIRSSPTPQAAGMIACSLINTRLDYCNSLPVNNTTHNIIRLQRVQNNLARVVLCKNRRTSVAPLIHDLLWLRINKRIQYKLDIVGLLLLMQLKLDNVGYLFIWTFSYSCSYAFFTIWISFDA